MKEYYVYTQGEEEMMTESDLITVDISSSNVEKMTGEKEITSVIFYNLAGQKVINPNNGVFIKKVNYADGTTSTFKVTKK